MYIETLKKIILFRGMTEDEISSCLRALNVSEKTFSKGKFLLHAGDPAEKMGIVLSGSVTIESNDIWGNCTILSHVGKGGFFAESFALLKKELMPVDVRANENSKVLFLNIGLLDALRPSEESWHRKLLANLLSVLTSKNLTLFRRNLHTSPKTIRGKLLSYLSSISLQKQSPEFDIPFDRQQLADYLNTDRTALSKELGKMKSEGIIDFRRSHFRLIDPQTE